MALASDTEKGEGCIRLGPPWRWLRSELEPHLDGDGTPDATPQEHSAEENIDDPSGWTAYAKLESRNDWAGVALTMALDRDLSIHDACIAEANLSLLHQKLKMRRIVRDIIQRYQDRCAPELGEDDELLDNLVTIQMKYHENLANTRIIYGFDRPSKADIKRWKDFVTRRVDQDYRLPFDGSPKDFITYANREPLHKIVGFILNHRTDNLMFWLPKDMTNVGGNDVKTIWMERKEATVAVLKFLCHAATLFLPSIMMVFDIVSTWVLKLIVLVIAIVSVIAVLTSTSDGGTKLVMLYMTLMLTIIANKQS